MIFRPDGLISYRAIDRTTGIEIIGKFQSSPGMRFVSRRQPGGPFGDRACMRTMDRALRWPMHGGDPE
jgi:hypothetical protein